MNSYVHTKFNHNLGNSISSFSENTEICTEEVSWMSEVAFLLFLKIWMSWKMTVITEQWNRPRSDLIWSPLQKPMFHTCYDHVSFWFCRFFLLFSFGPTFWGMFTVVRCEFIFLESRGMIPFSTVAGLNLHGGQSHFTMSCLLAHVMSSGPTSIIDKLLLLSVKTCKIAACHV
jgi:hypothetical protein